MVAPPAAVGQDLGYPARWARGLGGACLLVGLVVLAACTPTPGIGTTPGAAASPTAVFTPYAIRPTEGPFAGYLAPDFTLPDTAGAPVSLHSYRGHPVWINLWATWCGPCQTEMPEMQKLYTRYQGQGLVILGVDVQEDAGRVTAFVTKGGFTWPMLLDHDGLVARHYYLTGLPMHVFVDRAGGIQMIGSGGLTTAAMTEGLRRIMAP